MSTVSFIKAGDTEEKAIDLVCELTGEIIYKNFSSIESKKISIRCNNALQASILDDRLWGYPKNIYIPHKIITQKGLKDCDVLISYPGLKNEEHFFYLINLNPQIPSNYSDFKKTYQIVITDNSTFQNAARESYKKCLGDGLKPEFIEKNEKNI
tara:strand:+ start:638 stop:1099 length:462 start_codon:yes stop_codon:yes gene_type:complete